MVFYTTPLIAGPLILLLFFLDLYVFLTVARLVLGQFHAVEPTAAFMAMRTVTDPIPDSLGRWLATKRSKPTPRWLPWLLVIMASLLIRHVLLVFIVMAL